MKNLVVTRWGRNAVGILTLLTVLAGCSNDEMSPSGPGFTPRDHQPPSIDIDELFSGLGKDCKPGGPNYNLNVWLVGDKRGELGFIAFRQREGESQMIYLDTYVRGLEPNTSYILQRAVDTTLDGNCAGTAWLTLGKGLVPQSIVTNKGGVGHEALFRSVASIPVGSTFDIHFQILKESTSEVVLDSDCYEYTVR
jgi:hypothetical protein